ncbi:MAG TPA: cyclic nucleotide-binding and patatin-like phospholipase domain-containing protein [Gammaproteobacteria bacterium]|nr:cyclic nucleotide-binding and patatin-like phospholipase domain-containing protein [Gammaproteobacteria bacterium]
MTHKSIPDIIKSCDIFSALNRSEIKSLAAAATLIELKAGEHLFSRNEASRNAYILISGKLAATTATAHQPGELIGYIMPNEIVGEMSLLAETPRSLTVTAQTDCSLLTIHQQDFQQYCQNNPKLAFKILEVITKRAQGIIKHYEKSDHAQFVALLPANEQQDLNWLIHSFQQLYPNSDKATFLSYQEIEQAGDHIQQLLLSLKQRSDYVIYPINIHQKQEITDILMRYADKVVLTAPGYQAPQISPITLTLFNTHHIHTHNELVLFYDSQHQLPSYTKEWLDQGSFFRHHHIFLDKPADIQRLARFMTGSAVGVVLGGGGVKGWAHIGALKALLDANIPIDTIGGTSAGAAVGAAYLMTDDFDSFVAKYRKLTKSTLKTLATREITWPLISIFSGKSITATAQEEFSNHLLENLPRPFFCISCNITQKKESIHKQGKLWELIRTTASLPGVIPPMVLNNDLHVDGGVVNNLPVNVMSNFLENSGTIIAISISSLFNSTIPDYTFPPVISWWDALLIKCRLKKNYKFPSLFYTFIDSMLMGSFSQQRENMKKADILIQPDLSAYTFMGRKIPAEKLVEIGYQTTQKALEMNQELVQKIALPLSSASETCTTFYRNKSTTFTKEVSSYILSRKSFSS